MRIVKNNRPVWVKISIIQLDDSGPERFPMLRVTNFGPVTRFDLAHTLAGQGRYWTTFYAVDGLLIDSGLAYTARELVSALSGTPLVNIANTHSHEDHIGAN